MVPLKYHSSGLSNRQISTIPCTQISPQQFNSGITCNICLDDFTLGETPSKLPCNHYYHKNCIGEWLQHKNECPTCRAAPFDSVDAQGSYERLLSIFDAELATYRAQATPDEIRRRYAEFMLVAFILRPQGSDHQITRGD